MLETVGSADFFRPYSVFHVRSNKDASCEVLPSQCRTVSESAHCQAIRAFRRETPGYTLYCMYNVYLGECHDCRHRLRFPTWTKGDKRPNINRHAATVASINGI